MKRSPAHSAILLVGLLIFLSPIAPASGKEKKTVVTRVDFHGNASVGSSDLYDVMIMRPTGFLGMFHNVVYDRNILNEDLNFIELYYHQHGWLDAKIVDHSVEIDSTHHRARISITIVEGEQTFVKDVAPYGNQAFSDPEILAAFGIKPDEPLDREKNRAGSERIARLYAEDGYLEATVNPAVLVDKDSLQAFIDVAVTEGTQFDVGQIVMSGFKHTESFIVRRELTFGSGAILRYSELAKTQRNLYETGLFRSVFVRQEASIEGDSTKKDVLIEVVEKPPYVFTASVGYATRERLRGRLGIRNENLFGTGRAAGTEGWVSYVNRGVSFNYLEPWTFGFHWNTDVTLTAQYENEPGFDYTSYSGVVTVSRRIFDRGLFSVSYRHENAEYTNIDIIDFTDVTKPRIRSLSQAFNYDTRDNPFSPTRGYLGTVSNEYALQFLGSTNQFFKTNVSFRYFHSLSKRTVLGSHMEVGWVDAGGGLSDIPLSERLYAGGPNTLRGFPYRSLGPRDEDDGTPLGGRAKIVWNVLEVRQQLWRWFSGVAFYDLGNVFERTDVLRIDDLRHSPGLGLRVSSPIGLFRVDYGFNIFPKEGEDFGAWQISIGQAF